MCTSPTVGILSKTHHPYRSLILSSQAFKHFCLTEFFPPPPPPRNFLFLLWGSMNIFRRKCAMCINVCCIIYIYQCDKSLLGIKFRLITSSVLYKSLNTNNCIFNSLLASAAFLRHFNSMLTVQHCFNYIMHLTGLELFYSLNVIINL